MRGRTRCCSSPRAASVASPTIAGATAGQASRGLATTWTPTPTTWPRSSGSLDLKDAILVGSLHGWRRGGAVHRPPRHAPRREGGPDKRDHAADAEDAGQPRRTAASTVFDDIRAGVPAGPFAVLQGFASGPFFGANRPGQRSPRASIDSFWLLGMHGRPQERVRLHQGLLRNRPYRGSQEDRRPDSDRPRRRRSDRADRRLGARRPRRSSSTRR